MPRTPRLTNQLLAGRNAVAAAVGVAGVLAGAGTATAAAVIRRPHASADG